MIGKIFFVFSLLVVGYCLVDAGPLESIINEEEEITLKDFETLMDLVKNEGHYIDDAEVYNLLRRYTNHHLNKRAETEPANTNELRRRNAAAGPNLNAIWKTRVQRSNVRTPDLSALWKTRV